MTIFKNKLLSYFLLSLGISSFVVSCTGRSNQDGNQSSGVAPDTQKIVLQTVDNEKKFDRDSLTVHTGDPVQLKLINNATLPVMEHNVVIVKKGTEKAVALAGLDAGPDAHFVAPDDSNVVASTMIAGPGESVSVTFTPPDTGTYGFVCTYPGHYSMQKGVFRVILPPDSTNTK